MIQNSMQVELFEKKCTPFRSLVMDNSQITQYEPLMRQSFQTDGVELTLTP